MYPFLSYVRHGLKYRGLQVLLVLFLYLLTASFLPLKVHQGFYTFSLLLKDLLVWMLPITVSFFIAHAICSFHRQAPLFVFLLILFEGFSNFSSVWYAFAGGHLVADYLPPMKVALTNTDFSPLWRLPFSKPQWWAADKGTLVGLLLGFISSFSNQTSLNNFILQGKNIAQWILTRVFSRLIPVFILGFVARMYQTHVLHHMFAHYSLLLIWLIALLVIYLMLLFLISTGWSIPNFVRAVKNILPAGSIAFTSGCSLSTMPWTIEGTAKNLQNPHFAKAVIPATTNIQQIGDCIINAFLCFLIYRHFNGHNPDITTWLHFSIVFVLARFATAAVLGGAIFIMLPIYETHLSFNPEMIAMILAFNVLLDPLVTSSNVIANGALCRIFEKVWLRLGLAPLRQQR